MLFNVDSDIDICPFSGLIYNEVKESSNWRYKIIKYKICYDLHKRLLIFRSIDDMYNIREELEGIYLDNTSSYLTTEIDAEILKYSTRASVMVLIVDEESIKIDHIRGHVIIFDDAKDVIDQLYSFKDITIKCFKDMNWNTFINK